MIQQVDFIGREFQMAMIDGFVGEWKKRRMVYINAPGGYGKTRLIQEIRKRYMHGGVGDIPLIVSEIIDFDDIEFRTPRNICGKMASMFGKDFEPYQKKLLNYLNKVEDGIETEILDLLSQDLDRSFVECFKKIEEKSRVIWFFDTTDALAEDDVWNFLQDIEKDLENFVALIAGRNAGKIGKSQEKFFGKDICVLELPRFEPEASEAYLKKKQELFRITLEPELAKNLLLLASGRPIIIDLAVEWRSRRIPLDWLTDSKLEEEKNNNETGFVERQRELERQLVIHIANTRTKIDWLILLMSRVYPLDVEMIANLLDVSNEEAMKLFHDIRKYVFVKSLPDNRISLHDEMRRMVNHYVWPEVDPDGDLQRQDSKIAADFYKQKIHDVSEQISQIQSEMNHIHEGETTLSKSMSIIKLQRALWTLKEKRFGHLLVVNRQEAIHVFSELFDEATKSYNFGFRKRLVDQMKDHIQDISKGLKFDYESRYVKYLLDEGKYSEAIKASEQLLEYDLDDTRRVDTLIDSGNAKIKSGSLHSGISDFQMAIQLSKDKNLNDKLLPALTARGWAFRNMGDFDAAIKDYREAYLISLQVLDNKQIVLLSNNMSYLYAWKGEHSTASDHCNNALKLCKKMGFRRELGMTYGTFARNCELSDNTDTALDYYNKALDIFKSENDIEWMSRVRCSRASARLTKGDHKTAEKDLNGALEKGPKNLLPRIRFFQSNLHRYRNEFNSARKRLEECREYSQQIGDNFFDFVSFSCLIEVAWEIGEFALWRVFMDGLKRYDERKSEMDLRLRGTSLRRIGDLAICDGDFDTALKAYSEGLRLITEYENLKRYIVGEQIKTTESHISGFLEKDVMGRLGRDLGTFWKENNHLVEKSPETLFTFQRWGW